MGLILREYFAVLFKNRIFLFYFFDVPLFFLGVIVCNWDK